MIALWVPDWTPAVITVRELVLFPALPLQGSADVEIQPVASVELPEIRA